MHCCIRFGAVTDADRVRLGAELRRIRESSGLTGIAVGAALGWSQSKVSRMETGRFGASVREVAALLDHYGVPEEVHAELLSAVARNDGIEGAWTVRAGGATRRQAEVQAVESRVRNLWQYSALWIPGLLQSASYVRAVAKAGAFGDPAELVSRRLGRQRVLSEAPKLRYSVVLDERALVRWPGDDSVMADQLDHLAATMDAGRVDLRVHRFGGGATSFAVNSFIVYDFTSGQSVAMMEAQTADLYLSAESDIATYKKLFRNLQRESLDPDASRGHLEQLRSQLVS